MNNFELFFKHVFPAFLVGCGAGFVFGTILKYMFRAVLKIREWLNE